MLWRESLEERNLSAARLEGSWLQDEVRSATTRRAERAEHRRFKQEKVNANFFWPDLDQTRELKKKEASIDQVHDIKGSSIGFSVNSEQIKEMEKKSQVGKPAGQFSLRSRLWYPQHDPQNR